MTTLNERISKIIEYSKLSSSEFADEIDVQRSSISHITSGRNKPSLDFLIKVKDKFPELQWDWIIKGEGEMFENTQTETTENVNPKKAIALPDLFSLIDDENFGVTESEDRIQKEVPREFKISESDKEKEILSDSQRLGNKEPQEKPQVTDNQQNKIKRIIIFFENGKFESYEQ